MKGRQLPCNLSLPSPKAGVSVTLVNRLSEREKEKKLFFTSEHLHLLGLKSYITDPYNSPFNRKLEPGGLRDPLKVMDFQV